jgi:hypothetical protein
MRPRRAVDRGGNRVDGRGSRRAPVEGRSRRWRDCPPFKFDAVSHCDLCFSRVPPSASPTQHRTAPPTLLQIAHSPAHLTPPYSSLLFLCGSLARFTLPAPHGKLGDEVNERGSGDGGAGAEAGGAATARRQGPAAGGLVLPFQSSAVAYVTPLLLRFLSCCCRRLAGGRIGFLAWVVA